MHDKALCDERMLKNLYLQFLFNVNLKSKETFIQELATTNKSTSIQMSFLESILFYAMIKVKMASNLKLYTKLYLSFLL